MSTNIQLEYMIHVLKIPNYRGYFSKDELINNGSPQDKECLLINLQNSDLPGTHHLAVWKNHSNVRYFDSYGCPIPKEIEEYYKDFRIQYFRSLDGKYPDQILQGFKSSICGELSVLFIYLCSYTNLSFGEIIKLLQ